MTRRAGGRETHGHRRPRGHHLGSLVLAVAAVGAGVAPTVAQDPLASPAPTPVPVVGGQVDPRSSGEGPGLEAEPLLVLAGVLLLGVVAAGGTLLYVRVTRDD